MSISTKNTKLYYQVGLYWVQFDGVREVGTPKTTVEEIDVTDLDSTEYEYIPGISKADKVQFKILHTSSIFSTLDGLRGVSTDFKIVFSDSTGYSFTGFVSEMVSKAGVNGVVEWDVTISGISDVTALP